MIEFLNYYICLNLLFVVTWLGLKLIKLKRFQISYSDRLKLSYALLALSFVLPLMFYLLPSENPFGPIVKFENVPIAESTGTTAINIRLLPTDLSPQISGSMNLNWQIYFLIAFAFWITFKLVQYIRSHRSVLKLIHTSYLYKAIGKTQIWLSESAQQPFSILLRKAHIVLPAHSITDEDNLKAALLHEIQHHRNQDTRWVYFLELVRLILPLNPFVAWFISEVGELQELACDEALLGQKKLSPQQYGKCLYTFAEQQLSLQPTPIGAIGMAAAAHKINRRITIMFQQQYKTSMKAVASVTLLGVLCLSTAAWTFHGAVEDQQVSLAKAKSLAEKASLSQEIPIVVNDEVMKWLNKAVGSEKSRRYMRESLMRMYQLKPMIEQKLKTANLPLELIAVPLMESGYRNDAESTMKARGIWQFIPSTARRCGLKVNDHVDERLNPVRLTDAAVCYYTKLYAVFQNWYVATAAYNIGERRMTSVISDQAHNDVFRLGREGHLGNEGGNYLPKLMAAMIIVANPDLVE